MFQQIRLRKYYSSSHTIFQAYVTNKGLFAIANHNNTINMFHQTNPEHAISVEKQLEQNFDFKYKKCVSINSLSFAPQSKDDCILLLLDQTFCIIWVKLITHQQSQQGHHKLRPQILGVQLLPILTEQQKTKKKRQVKLVGVSDNKAVLFVHIPRNFIKMCTYSIYINEKITIQTTNNLTLSLEDPNQNELNSLLINYNLKLYNHYVFLYQTFGKRQQAHIFFYINILDAGQQVKIMRLPDNDYFSALKDIYVVPLSKQIQSSTILLFYQIKGYLQIVQINLQTPTVPLKKVQHTLILHKIISSSMTPQALELKGQKYCMDTLNFLIHGCDDFISKDKLLIVAAPFAHKATSIVNDILISQLILRTISNETSNYTIIKKDLYQIIRIPKSRIYSELLLKLSDSEALARIVQQILD